MCGSEHFAAVACVKNPGTKGADYVCADGGRIPNFGEKRVRSLIREGAGLDVVFQVTLVDRPLILVSKLTRAGHHVTFGPCGASWSTAGRAFALQWRAATAST